MQNQLRQLYRSLLLFNSVLFIIYGFWLLFEPYRIAVALETFSGFAWEELVFNEPLVGTYLNCLLRLLAGFEISIGIAGFLLIYYGAGNADISYKHWIWWAILPLQIVPCIALIVFDFYTSKLGALEMIKMVVGLLSLMAWWRLRL